MFSRFPLPQGVPLTVGLLSLALLIGGFGLARPVAGDEPKQEKKTDSKKEESKKDGNKDKNKIQKVPDADDLDEEFKNLPQGVDPRHFQQMQEQMQRMMEQMRRQFAQAGAMRGSMPGMFGRDREGRLGVLVAPPTPTLTDQLDLPKDQGLVVENVQEGSAAAKAGLKNNDILLEFNGKPVPANPRDFAKQLDAVKAKTPVDAIVLRKGKRETIKGITLAEARHEAADEEFPFFKGIPGGVQAPFPGNVPVPPGVAIAPNAGIGGAFPAFPGANSVSTSVFRTDNRFTTRHQDGSLVITLTGTIADGKAQVSSIHVQDGRESHDYASVDKVAERYRDKVKNLLEMSEKSGVKVEFKTPKA
jgi:membrane-associated protease RseP (regulator of RpoE activity)